MDEHFLNQIRNNFQTIKKYLYYDIDVYHQDTSIEYNDDGEDVIITTTDVKFCSKYNGAFYGPVLIEHVTYLSYEIDDGAQYTDFKENVYIMGTLWDSKAIGIWTYQSMIEDDIADPFYCINAKVKYDDYGNVKKTKIWEPETNVIGGIHTKPAIKVDGYHPLDHIFWNS